MIPLLLSLALLAPADTPIEPIDSSVIELGIEAGILDEMCETYPPLVSFLRLHFVDDPEFVERILETVDTWVVDAFEENFSPSARMTDEAETVFLDYLHECAS